MKLARVFPRRTKATPVDDMAFYDGPPLFLFEADEVHVSCTFVEDEPKTEWLASLWKAQGYNVKIGGPAYDDPGGEFVPGRYVKPGYVMTSRGCNNNCWFCMTPKREGTIREIPITEGWNVLDSNLLQCSEKHIRQVFAMLHRQPHEAQLTGGLEAKELRCWHVELLAVLRPQCIWFAYDTPDDYEPLQVASKMLAKAGFALKDRTVCCYVLIGFAKDTMLAAEQRLSAVLELGIMPMAMLYSDGKIKPGREWKRFQRSWARPAAIFSRVKKIEAADA